MIGDWIHYIYPIALGYGPAMLALLRCAPVVDGGVGFFAATPAHAERCAPADAIGVTTPSDDPHSSLYIELCVCSSHWCDVAQALTLDGLTLCYVGLDMSGDMIHIHPIGLGYGLVMPALLHCAPVVDGGIGLAVMPALTECCAAADAIGATTPTVDPHSSHSKILLVCSSHWSGVRPYILFSDARSGVRPQDARCSGWCPGDA